jgi:hypothetical protein
MFQTKSCRGNQNTHFVFQNVFSPPENRAVYDIMWKNIVERGRPQMTIWRMRTACWIPKATNTHSEYVIRIAFPQQQWLYQLPQCYVIHTLPAIYFRMRPITNTQLQFMFTLEMPDSFVLVRNLTSFEA